MKLYEKNQSIELRRKGLSIKKIASRLNVSKSSVSLWVRDVSITKSQRSKLDKYPHTIVAVEKRRLSRLKNESIKRESVIISAQKEIGTIALRELWLMGVMLYWAEGGKTQRTVRFSNGDPEMIKIMMKFFRIICKVPEAKFRGYIHIHDHLDHKKAKLYWSSISGIPTDQFFKTYLVKDKVRKSDRNSLPNGVMDVYVLDTHLFLLISG